MPGELGLGTRRSTAQPPLVLLGCLWVPNLPPFTCSPFLYIWENANQRGGEGPSRCAQNKRSHYPAAFKLTPQKFSQQVTEVGEERIHKAGD